jgi:hypothetical protein
MVIDISEKLPYLKQLGVTALYLNPVFAAPSVHKYDTEVERRPARLAGKRFVPRLAHNLPSRRVMVIDRILFWSSSPSTCRTPARSGWPIRFSTRFSPIALPAALRVTP